MEVIKILNSVFVTLTSAFTLGVIIIKPFRNWIMGVRKEKAEKDDREQNQVETDKCLLRDRILHTYYKKLPIQQLHCYEYENISRMYVQYKKLGGNSFIDKIWGEMQEWEVVE